jgi:hypothetical protein
MSVIWQNSAFSEKQGSSDVVHEAARAGFETKRAVEAPQSTFEARRGLTMGQLGPIKAPLPESDGEGSLSRP